jgi:hypothetical protein
VDGLRIYKGKTVFETNREAYNYTVHICRVCLVKIACSFSSSSSSYLFISPRAGLYFLGGFLYDKLYNDDRSNMFKI